MNYIIGAIVNMENISDKQGIILVTLFIIGSSVIEVSGLEAEKDLWIAVIIGLMFALPLVFFVFARLLYIFPGKDLFDIIEICFGKYVGKVIILVFSLFMFEEGAELIRNVGQFIIVTSLNETSLLIPMACIVFLSIWVIKEGIEVLARWGEFFIIIIIFSLFIGILFSIPNMNINNIRPVLSNGLQPVFKGAFEVFIFPFAQTLSFTMIFSCLRMKKSPYRVYIISVLIGGTILFLISINGLLVLGSGYASEQYYANYAAIKRLKIGNFLERIEITIATTFVLSGFVKGGIYLLATCKGVTKLFKFKNYRFIVTPIAALMLNLAYFEFDSVIDFFEFSEVWYYYVFPFLVIMPIIILICAEIKKKKGKL